MESSYQFSLHFHVFEFKGLCIFIAPAFRNVAWPLPVGMLGSRKRGLRKEAEGPNVLVREEVP